MKKSVNNEKTVLRTWIDIDTKAIAQNLRVFRKIVGKDKLLLGVVKSNAYGHGLVDWSLAVERLGIDWLGVDSLVEAFALRRAGVKIPILSMGYTLPALLPRAQKERIAVTVSSFDQLKQVALLRKQKVPLRVHIKIDTGMHRQGFQATEMEQLVALLKHTLPKGGFVVEGLYTHFAKAKDPRDRDSVYRQLREFEAWKEALSLIEPRLITHASATSGAMLFPNAHFAMVRIGIGMYGLWPAKDVERHLAHKLTLRPALSWEAMVSEVKVVKSGERIGYDLSELLMRDTTVAIVPIGYWHGFPRMLSSRGRVLIKGKSARVLGRVSMNMITVDVTDIPRVAPGDIATIIGRDGKEEILAGEIASLSASTHYEVVTRINPLIKKFYR